MGPTGCVSKNRARPQKEQTKGLPNGFFCNHRKRAIGSKRDTPNLPVLGGECWSLALPAMIGLLAEMLGRFIHKIPTEKGLSPQTSGDPPPQKKKHVVVVLLVVLHICHQKKAPTKHPHTHTHRASFQSADILPVAPFQYAWHAVGWSNNTVFTRYASNFATGPPAHTTCLHLQQITRLIGTIRCPMDQSSRPTLS